MDGTGEEELVDEGLGARAGGGSEGVLGGEGGEGAGVEEEEVAEVEGVGDGGGDGRAAGGMLVGGGWWDWGGAHDLVAFAVEVEGECGGSSIAVSVSIMCWYLGVL